MNTIPAENDWRGSLVERLVDRIVFGSRREDLGLDGECAYRQFVGKTHSEAVEMFQEASLNRQEDLMWMPLRCFEFYVNAYIEYLRSECARGDADGANAFFGLTQFRLHEIKRLEKSLKQQIVETINFLGNSQKWFDADPEIYGSFAERADGLLRELDA
jgi:hypothetical protein